MGSYSYLYISVPEVHEKDVLPLLRDQLGEMTPADPSEPGVVTYEGEVKYGDYSIVEPPHDYVDSKWTSTGPPRIMEWVEKGIPFNILDLGDGGELSSRMTFWRPGMEKPRSLSTDTDGNIVITLADLDQLKDYEAVKEYLSQPPPII